MKVLGIDKLKETTKGLARTFMPMRTGRESP